VKIQKKMNFITTVSQEIQIDVEKIIKEIF